MTAFISVRVRDYSDEYSTLKVPIAEALITDTWQDIQTKGANLVDALEDLILGTIVSWTFTQNGAEYGDERPSSPFAQREVGLRVFVTGEHSGRKSNFTIPTPDLAAIPLVPGTDLVDLADTDMAALVTWIEANVEIPIPNLPPLPGYWNDDVTIDRMVVVGRSS